jgi:hypothetical protein
MLPWLRKYFSETELMSMTHISSAEVHSTVSPNVSYEEIWKRRPFKSTTYPKLEQGSKLLILEPRTLRFALTNWSMKSAKIIWIGSSRRAPPLTDLSSWIYTWLEKQSKMYTYGNAIHTALLFIRPNFVTFHGRSRYVMRPAFRTAVWIVLYLATFTNSQ